MKNLTDLKNLISIKIIKRNNMLYIAYDFTNDKQRAKFSKFLNKYGRKKQYSVYMLKNSERVLEIILKEIEKNFAPKFEKSDSIIIIPISPADQKKIIRYGYSSNDDEEILFFS